jgi:rubredoxin
VLALKRTTLHLRCDRCDFGYELVSTRPEHTVDDDQVLDVALDFACPYCGGDFRIKFVAAQRGTDTSRGCT